MFEKYGEFDSCEEINKKAAELLEQGDKAGVLALAKENGIDKEDAQDYADGCVKELTTPLMAALGKLEAEAKDLKIGGIMLDWKNYITDECMNETKMQVAVRKKVKSMKECMSRLIRFSFEHKVQVSDKILKITKVTHNGKEEPFKGPLYLGVPNAAEARKIIREYYLS